MVQKVGIVTLIEGDLVNRTNNAFLFHCMRNYLGLSKSYCNGEVTINQGTIVYMKKEQTQLQ